MKKQKGGVLLVYIEDAIRFCTFAIPMALGQIVFLMIGGIIESLAGICMGYTITGIHFWNDMFTWKSGKFIHYKESGDIGLRMCMYSQNSSAKKCMKISMITSVCMTLLVGIYGVALIVNQWDAEYAKVYFGLCCIFLVMQWEKTTYWLKWLYGRRKNKADWEEYILYLEKLKAGILPAEIEMKEIILKDYWGKKLSHFFQHYIMVHYYHYLDAGKFDKVKEYIEFLEQYVEQESCTGREEKWYLYEILYFYCVIEPDLEIAECYYSFVNEMIDTDIFFCACRVRAAYDDIKGVKKEIILMKIEEGLRELEKRNNQEWGNLENRMLLSLKEKIQNRGDEPTKLDSKSE